MNALDSMDEFHAFGDQLQNPPQWNASGNSSNATTNNSFGGNDGNDVIRVAGEAGELGCALVFFTCILPLFFLFFLPIWSTYRRQRRLRDESQRQALSSKLANTIREIYIFGLMKDYTMVLSKSDVLDDNYDAEEEDTASEGSSIDSCAVRIITSDGEKEVNGGISPSVGDIEMQGQHSIHLRGENDVGDDPSDANETEDDDNDNDNPINESIRSHHRTPAIRVPLPGHTAGEARVQNQEQEQDQSHCRRTHHGRCAICLEAFEAQQSVTWSSNPECRHVFHHDCLLEWYTGAAVRAFWAEIRRRDRLAGTTTLSDRETPGAQHRCDHLPRTAGACATSHRIQRLFRRDNIDTPCPCCRREFFVVARDPAGPGSQRTGPGGPPRP